MYRHSLILVGIFSSCLLLSGCIKRIPIPADLTQENVLDKLQQENSRRHQLVALIKARGAGLKRFLGSVEFDVIAQAPDKLYLATRSFFSQPVQVFGFDGSSVTFLDLTDGKTPRYFEELGSRDALLRLIPLAISPDDIAKLLLGIAPSKNSNLTKFSIDDIRGTLTMDLNDSGRNRITISASLIDQVMLKYTINDYVERTSYSVEYGDFRIIEGIRLAHKLYVKVEKPTENFEIILEASEVSLNGEAFAKEVFHVARP